MAEMEKFYGDLIIINLYQSRWIESTVARVVPYRLSPCLAEIADFAEFWTKKIKLKSFKHQIFQCPQLYGGI